VHFGIQKAAAGNDPPSVLAWQIGVTDIDAAMERCRSADVGFELEHGEIPCLFGPVVPISCDASNLDRALSLTGRDPAWSPK
jgi:hypothetical protein